MRKVPLLTVAMATLVGCSASGGDVAQPFAPVASVLEVMEALMIPFSDSIFAAASEPPDSDEGWDDIKRAALALAESGNLLMMPGRAPVGDTTWTARALLLVRAAESAAEAATRRNGDALFEASDQVYESCVACHQLYLIAPEN